MNINTNLHSPSIFRQVGKNLAKTTLTYTNQVDFMLG